MARQYKSYDFFNFDIDPRIIRTWCISITDGYTKVFSKAKFDAIKRATQKFVTDDKYDDWNKNKDLLIQLINL